LLADKVRDDVDETAENQVLQRDTGARRAGCEDSYGLEDEFDSSSVAEDALSHNLSIVRDAHRDLQPTL
jgi:hypothetical protein